MPRGKDTALITIMSMNAFLLLNLAECAFLLLNLAECHVQVKSPGEPSGDLVLIGHLYLFRVAVAAARVAWAMDKGQRMAGRGGNKPRGHGAQLSGSHAEGPEGSFSLLLQA